MKIFRLFLILLLFSYYHVFSQTENSDTEKKNETQSLEAVDAKEYFGEALELNESSSILSITSEEGLNEEQHSTAPQISTFTTNPDALGAIANSVNNFTGDVNMPLNLISLPGRNGLDVNVSISYSSNVHKSVGIWNKEAPTGILGLGWSMPYSKIIVDNQQTGTREDDVFYLSEGGSNVELIRDGEGYDSDLSLDYKIYKTVNYQPWIIRYYYNDAVPTNEFWAIVKENGVEYIFGGNTTAQQYIVKWDNWIGNSSVNGNSIEQVTAWNLSSIKNRWNDEVQFEYKKEENYVKNTNEIQTEACYLEKITDVYGRVVQFYYADKFSNEYKEPHSEQSEGTAGDAYQEVYEKLFLDYIEVKNKYDEELFTIDFNYGQESDFLDYGSNIEKRLLKSITQKNKYGESLPSIQFSYRNASPNKGALSQVIMPAGGSVTFHYKSQNIENSERNFTLAAPDGYSDPTVWIAEDYIVATFSTTPSGDDNARTLKVYAYQWDGEWVGEELITITNLRKDDIPLNHNFTIRLEKDFFALQILTINVHENTKLYVFEKNKLERGKWNLINPGGTVYGKAKETFTTLLTGENFAAIYYHNERNGYVNGYTRRGNSWTSDIDFRINAENQGSITQSAVVSANNFICIFAIIYDNIRLHYLDENLNWQTNTTITLNTNDQIAHWIAGNNFVSGYVNGYGEKILSWDEQYEFSSNKTTQGLNDISFVTSVANDLVGFVGNSMKMTAARFDGVEWKLQNGNQSNSRNYRSTFGNDFFVRRYDSNGSSDRNWRIYIFNPNTSSWTSTYVNDSDLLDTSISEPETRASYDLFVLGKNVLTRDDNGEFTVKYALPTTQDLYVGFNYIKYGTSTQTKMIPIKNGEVRPDLTYTYSKLSQRINLTGAYAFVTHSGGSGYTSANTLTFHRIVDHTAGEKQIDYPVSYVEVNGKHTTQCTAYDFDKSNATIDPTGNIAQYNKVKVVPGSSTASDSNPPYGYTENYFMNGLPDQVTDLTDDASNANDNYNLLKGTPYQSKVFDADGDEVSSSISYYKVTDISEVSEIPDLNKFSYYARIVQKEETLDGVTTTTKYEYNTEGLLNKTIVENYNSYNELEEIITETEYAYEHAGDDENYNVLVDENILTPVYEKISKTNTTVTGKSITEWTTLNDKFVPYKTSIWNTSSETYKDISEIQSIDDKGNVLESLDLIDNIYSGSIYDSSYLPVASFSNTEVADVFAENFDDKDLTDGKPGSWTFGAASYWDYDNGKLRFTVGSSGYGDYASPSIEIDQDVIYEYDIRLGDSYVQTDWGAFQFRKQSGTDSPWDSGYFLILRTNGTLELKKASDATGRLGIYTGTLNVSRWQRIRVACSGDNIKVYYNGKKVIDVDDSEYSGQYFGFYAYHADAEFDNFITYSNDAYAGIVSRDFDLMHTVSSSDGSGLSTRTLYDSFNSPVAVIDYKGVPVSSVMSSLSVERNDGDYVTSDPNVTLSTSVTGKEGFYEAFDLNLDNWTAENSAGLSSWTVDNEMLVHNNSGDGSGSYDKLYYDFENELTGRVGIEFSVKVPEASFNTNFGFAAGGNEWDREYNTTENALWTYFNSTTFYNASALSSSQTVADWLQAGKTYRIKIIIDIDNEVTDLYVDGKPCVYNEQILNTSTGIRYFSFNNKGEGNATEWEIDNFIIYTDPVHSITYSDAAGKELQSQVEESNNNFLVSQNLYDDLGRAAVSLKTTRISDTEFAYISNYVSGYDWTNDIISGLVKSENDNESYPYSRTVFEDSPLGRPIEQSIPGSGYQVGSGNTTTFLYFSNMSTSFTGFNTSEGRYFVKLAIDPEGTYSYEMTDKIGNTVAQKYGPLDGLLESQFKYDAYGNLEEVRTPNYYSLGTTYKSNSYYDGFQRLTQSTSPDAGAVEYLYDDADRTRFILDGNGRNASVTNNIIYFNYDDLGRITEEGYFEYEWSSITTANINSKAWPSGQATWRKKYTYGTFEDYTSERDAVMTVEVNNNSDTGTEVVESFAYDVEGNVLSKTITITDFDELSKTVSYEYDGAGQVTKVNYGQGTTPVDLVLPAGEITNTRCYFATNSITAGTDVSVESTGDLTLTAVTEVILLPGFHAKSGCTFKGEISTVSNCPGGGSGADSELEVTYAYDRIGRVTDIGIPDDPDFFASYTYDLNGQVQYENINNSSLQRTYTYGETERLTCISDSEFEETITYNSGGAGFFNGNIYKINNDYKTSTDLNHEVTYDYDDYNRLITANSDMSDGSRDVGVAAPIEYDDNGNLQELTRGGVSTSYTYVTGTNKVSSAGSSTFTYDYNGNVETSAGKDIDPIEYDPFFNLAVTITRAEEYMTAFRYGADHQRVYKEYYTDDSEKDKTAYIHGLSDYPLMESRQFYDAVDENTFYVYGPTGLIAYNKYGQWDFVLKDHLGSTRLVVKNDNTVSSYYDYLPFGGIVYEYSESDPNYKFTGQEYDGEIALHNFRARLYDSEAGIFYGMDPAGQGFSPYGYGGGRPIMIVDKDGRFWHIVAGAVIGGIINTALHWDKIESPWDAVGAFGIGAAGGALAAATGGAVLTAAGGTIMAGAGGFMAGFASGAVGFGFGATATNIGNTMYFNDPYPSLKDQAIGLGISALTAGLINGFTATSNGLSFLNGDPGLPSLSSAPALSGSIGSNTSSAAKPAQLAKANIDDLVDDGASHVDDLAYSLDDNLPTNLKIIPKSEVPSNLNIGRQGKHILGHNNFQPGRSVLEVNPNELLTGFSKGQFNTLRVLNNKVVVDFGKTIGKFYQNGVLVGPTRYGIIHYGVGGAHIVPANPIQY
ncbi:MAG: polymorphic toxin type 50 domain-containing protein [Ignavibacteria bacterium]|jgi:RHS repeat-associated protein